MLNCFFFIKSGSKEDKVFNEWGKRIQIDHSKSSFHDMYRAIDIYNFLFRYYAKLLNPQTFISGRRILWRLLYALN